MPLAMGVSLTRRTFFLGTALVAVAQSLTYGAAITVLSTVERATGGWGTGLLFWSPIPGPTAQPVLHTLISASCLLAFISSGIGMGVVVKRCGPDGVSGLILGPVLLFGALTVLITWLRGWDDVGGWLSAHSTSALMLGLPLALAAVVAALSYAGLRRVVP